MMERPQAPDFTNDYELRHWLYERVSGLEDTYKGEDYLKTALLLLDWVGRHATFSHKELVLDHAEDPFVFLKKLLVYEGGTWCGGVAQLYHSTMRAFPGLHSAKLGYGYHDPSINLTHMTNLVGLKDGKCYNLDAYLGYYYTDPDGELLDFGEVLAHIKQKEYDCIRRVDVPLPRPAVTLPDDNGKNFGWLFDKGVPEPEVYEDRLVFQGAMASFPALFCEGSRNRRRADQQRGGQPFEEFVLDLIMVEPTLTRFCDVSQSFPEYNVIREMLYKLMEI